MTERGWHHFSHGADLGICGWGPSAEVAFEEAASALSAAVTTEEIKSVERVQISCNAPDLELLLVAWLNALIYEMSVRKMLFGRFAVTISGCELAAEAWGENVDRERHRPVCEPKGATFTELKVFKDQAGHWTARCVVDV